MLSMLVLVVLFRCEFNLSVINNDTDNLGVALISYTKPGQTENQNTNAAIFLKINKITGQLNDTDGNAIDEKLGLLIKGE
jgi:hypothetical protein